jgi:antirestriction protein ArdC
MPAHRVFFIVRVTLSGINHITLASELRAKPLPRPRWLILRDSTGWLGAAASALKSRSRGCRFTWHSDLLQYRTQSQNRVGIKPLLFTARRPNNRPFVVYQRIVGWQCTQHDQTINGLHWKMCGRIPQHFLIANLEKVPCGPTHQIGFLSTIKIQSMSVSS